MFATSFPSLFYSRLNLLREWKQTCSQTLWEESRRVERAGLAAHVWGQKGLAVLTDWLPCVDVDDKARGLVPTQDLVLSWKGNTTVMAMPAGQPVRSERDEGQEWLE